MKQLYKSSLAQENGSSSFLFSLLALSKLFSRLLAQVYSHGVQFEVYKSVMLALFLPLSCRLNALQPLLSPAF